LGDNIFDHNFSPSIKSFKSGAIIFAKKISDPQRFGVVEFNQNKKVISLEEKPSKPKSDYAVVGLYVYDNKVIKYAQSLKPSARGEIEITDLNKVYLKKNQLKAKIIKGTWADAGTFDSLLEISNIMAQKAQDKLNN